MQSTHPSYIFTATSTCLQQIMASETVFSEITVTCANISENIPQSFQVFHFTLHPPPLASNVAGYTRQNT